MTPKTAKELNAMSAEQLRIELHKAYAEISKLKQKMLNRPPTDWTLQTR